MKVRWSSWSVDRFCVTMYEAGHDSVVGSEGIDNLYAARLETITSSRTILVGERWPIFLCATGLDAGV